MAVDRDSLDSDLILYQLAVCFDGVGDILAQYTSILPKPSKQTAADSEAGYKSKSSAVGSGRCSVGLGTDAGVPRVCCGSRVGFVLNFA